jgi:hypothetical protein
MVYANGLAGFTNRLYVIFVVFAFVTIALGSCNRPDTEEPAPPRPDKIDPNPSPAYLTPEESM